MSSADKSAREDFIRALKEIRELAEGVVDAMQSSERPNSEDAGIAFVCGEAIIDIVAKVELDLICEQLAAAA